MTAPVKSSELLAPVYHSWSMHTHAQISQYNSKIIYVLVGFIYEPLRHGSRHVCDVFSFAICKTEAVAADVSVDIEVMRMAHYRFFQWIPVVVAVDFHVGLLAFEIVQLVSTVPDTAETQSIGAATAVVFGVLIFAVNAKVETG